MDEKKSSQLQRVIMPSNWLLVVSYLVQRFHPIATQAHVLDFGLNSSTCTTIPPSKLGIFPSHPKTLNVCHMQNIKKIHIPFECPNRQLFKAQILTHVSSIACTRCAKGGCVLYNVTCHTPFIPYLNICHNLMYALCHYKFKDLIQVEIFVNKKKKI